MNVEDTDNGTVTASVKSASKGSTVTLTVKPDEGYQLDQLTVTDKGRQKISLTEKEDGKYTFTMPASEVSVSAAFTKSEEKPEQIAGFTDVLTTDWFADAVQYAVDNGMMNGTSETTFHPNGTTTRGMIVAILYRLEKEPAVDNGAGFADVAAGKYYADAVAWASANDIVTGYSEEKFGPDDAITREQLAAILYRYAQYKNIDVTATADLSGYADAAQISAYAETAMKWANGEGLITGVTDTMLKPAGNATRAQAATILMRFCENAFAPSIGRNSFDNRKGLWTAPGIRFSYGFPPVSSEPFPPFLTPIFSMTEPTEFSGTSTTRRSIGSHSTPSIFGEDPRR